MKTIWQRRVFGLCFAVAMILSWPVLADITITPTRILFEDRDRFKEVTLVNTSGEKKTYEIGWLFFRMKEEGVAYEPVEASITDFDLTKYIVYTPRRVTLPPGGKQKVRLALRRPPEVPPGEYRAHLRFAGVRTEEAQGSEQIRPSASVQVNVGYSIPVVFQSGDVDADAVIEGLSLKRNPENNRLVAVVSIARSDGLYGALGHLYIYYGDEVVGEISNAHLFSEVNRRVFEVPLLRDDLSGGALRVVYEYFDPLNPYVFDEKSFPIQ